MGQMLIALDFDLGPVEEIRRRRRPDGRGHAAGAAGDPTAVRAGQGRSAAAGVGVGIARTCCRCWRTRRPKGRRRCTSVGTLPVRRRWPGRRRWRRRWGRRGEAWNKGIRRCTSSPGRMGRGRPRSCGTFLPKYEECLPFVNADMIAQGLSPFAPEAAALRAGRLVLEQIKDLSRRRVDFGLETTLSGKSYAPLFRRLRQEGYRIDLFFLWIPDADMAVARVADRVRRGGHHIPENDIRRRRRAGDVQLRRDLPSAARFLDSFREHRPNADYNSKGGGRRPASPRRRPLRPLPRRE